MQTEEKYKRLKIPKDVHKTIKKCAADLDVSMTALVRDSALYFHKLKTSQEASELPKELKEKVRKS